MRYALSGSALVHAGIFGAALLGFAWPQPEDAPAAGAVTVDIITMESVSTNASSTLESATAQNQVSAGAEPVKSQTVEPVEPETLAPAEPAEPALVSQAIQPITPTTAPVAPITPPVAAPSLLATMAEAVETAAIAPLQPVAPDDIAPAAPVPATVASVVEPVATSDMSTAPVPHTLSFTRPSKPTPRAAAPRKPTPPPAQVAGNGGSNNADAAAGKAAAGQPNAAGGGGAAEMAPWERQVRRRLAGAQRYPRGANGASGDVVVSFTISAGGALSGLRIMASSGNPLLDQAALDTVARAAPFPPIPAGAGLSSKDVAIPLGFVR